MSDDWYRRKAWTAADQDEFFARLRRSRSQYNKAQYLRIQAVHLEDEHPKTALELLRLVVSEFPEPCELAQTYLQMAHCQTLFDPEAAIQSFRKALAQETEYPSSLTQAYLDFPLFVVIANRTDFFPEVETILSTHASRLMFPADQYKYHLCRALIAEHNGDSFTASKHAFAALSAAERQHSGFRYHPKVGLVKKQDQAIQKRLAGIVAAQQSASADADKPRR